jgi:hypothetical protein
LKRSQYEEHVPTVADRIAQTVARLYLQLRVEPVFHPDSYGYRPGKSALDAVAVCRQRCWRTDWVIDMDIRAFFDTVPWDLVLRAVDEPLWPLRVAVRRLPGEIGGVSEYTLEMPPSRMSYAGAGSLASLEGR